MHSSRSAMRQIVEGKPGIIVKEEPCRLLLSSGVIETECRVAFRVDEFPSCEIEIPDLDSASVGQSSVSLEFPRSGIKLENLIFGGIPFSDRPQGYPYRYRLRHEEPMLATKPGVVVEMDAFIFNMSRFSFKGYPSQGLDPLMLEVDHWRFEIGPVLGPV